MRPFAVAFGLLLSLSSFSTAYARPSLSPRSSSFTAKGQVTFSKGAVHDPCTAHFAGNTDASGYGHITSMAFTGDAFCTSIVASGLPALLNAETRKRGTLHSVGFNTMYGFCSAASPTIWINSAGRFYFDFFMNPDCVLNGYVKATPAITIFKP